VVGNVVGENTVSEFLVS